MQPIITVDYAVFVVFVVASTVYPILHDIRSRKEKMTKKDFAFATGQVSMFAVMMSIARGQLGVRTFIGFPSEQYYRGSAMWETIYGILFAYPVVIFFFLPVYFALDITSIYQYFDMRFKHRAVRDIASAIYIFRSSLGLGVTLYTPCVALYTIVDVPIYASLLGLTGISICFTLFGGLRAAITADLIQGVVIIVTCLLVIALGVYESGGVANVYTSNLHSGRFKFFHVTGDLRTRVDTLSAFLGQSFMTLSILGCQQNLVQRYLSLKSEKRARKALFLNIPFVFVLFSLPWIAGAVVYGSYASCDPQKMGLTHKMDEILPFFVKDKLFFIPGFVGLFLGTLFNGALCVSVSNINALAVVTWEDFVTQVPRFNKVADRSQLKSIKVIGVIYSFLILGISFTVSLLSGVIESAMLISSATTGPLVGVFLLALFVPVCNWKGASAGMLVALTVCCALSMAFLIVDKPNSLLETSVHGCSNTTFSPWMKNRTAKTNFWVFNENDVTRSVTGDVSVFAFTYMYYGVLGTVISIVVGAGVSLCTRSDNSDHQYEAKLLHPYVVRLTRWWGIALRNVMDDSTSRAVDAVEMDGNNSPSKSGPIPIIESSF